MGTCTHAHTHTHTHTHMHTHPSIQERVHAHTHTHTHTHTRTHRYQSVLNLRTVLQLIESRHARIKRYTCPCLYTLTQFITTHPHAHTYTHRCSRETDGAGSYNSVFVALFSLQLGRGGKSGNIRIVAHRYHTVKTPYALTLILTTDTCTPSHNEPGHGADICDTAGANCIRECWRWTKRTGLSIISASKTCVCLMEANMQGFVHLQVRT